MFDKVFLPGCHPGYSFSSPTLTSIETYGVTLNVTVIDVGISEIVVTASDTVFSVSDTFMIEVIPENQLRIFHDDTEIFNSDTICVLQENSFFDLSVKSDVSWGFITTTYWLTVSMADDSIVRVEYEKNPLEQDRRGSITIQDNQNHKFVDS